MAQQQAPKDQNDVSALLLTDGSGNTMMVRRPCNGSGFG